MYIKVYIEYYHNTILNITGIVTSNLWTIWHLFLSMRIHYVMVYLSTY